LPDTPNQITPLLEMKEGVRKMPLGMGVPKGSAITRRETRIPMEVGVHISGHAALPGAETTFTENVSTYGACILSTRRWKINDRLIVTTMAGAYRAAARVAYCRSVPGMGFAVGVEFPEPRENWFVAGGSFH
jgi:hypothetical protein